MVYFTLLLPALSIRAIFRLKYYLLKQMVSTTYTIDNNIANFVYIAFLSK